MMDEINEEEDFVVEGPLWIQVHAFEKGICYKQFNCCIINAFYSHIISLLTVDE
jgi:hypothetical protein